MITEPEEHTAAAGGGGGGGGGVVRAASQREIQKCERRDGKLQRRRWGKVRLATRVVTSTAMQDNVSECFPHTL